MVREPVGEPDAPASEDMRLNSAQFIIRPPCFVEVSKGPVSSKSTGRHNTFAHVPEDPNRDM